MSAVPLDVAAVLDDFDVGPLTVERRAPPAQNVWGGFDAAAPALVQLAPVAVHNVQGRDLDQLPEADRASETIQIYTRQRLYTATDGQAPDVVLYQGRRWRVATVRDFALNGEVYCALAVLEDPQAEP